MCPKCGYCPTCGRSHGYQDNVYRGCMPTSSGMATTPGNLQGDMIQHNLLLTQAAMMSQMQPSVLPGCPSNGSIPSCY